MEKVKLSSVADMIVYLCHKNSSRNLLQMINTFSKLAGYKINTEKITNLGLYHS